MARIYIGLVLLALGCVAQAPSAQTVELSRNSTTNGTDLQRALGVDDPLHMSIEEFIEHLFIVATAHRERARSDPSIPRTVKRRYVLHFDDDADAPERTPQAADE